RAAAVDQYVGDGFRQQGATRDGIEMFVRGLAADVNEVEIGKTNCAADHRTRDFDIAIVGELAYHRERKARQRGEVGGNIDPRIVRDVGDDVVNNLVE